MNHNRFRLIVALGLMILLFINPVIASCVSCFINLFNDKNGPVVDQLESTINKRLGRFLLRIDMAKKTLKRNEGVIPETDNAFYFMSGLLYGLCIALIAFAIYLSTIL